MSTHVFLPHEDGLYSVGHNLILAHAHAVKIYRERYKPTQHGQIGITLNGDWQMPYDHNPESKFRCRFDRMILMLIIECYSEP